MKCKYRNCDNEVKQKEGKGRKRHYCDDKCKHMEFYYSSRKGE